MSIEKFLYTFAGVLFLVGLYFIFAPHEFNVSYYYRILDTNQKDNTLDSKKIEIDLKSLDYCKLSGKGNSSESCYIDFYRKYTIEHGPVKALEHLSTMIDNDPEIIPGCHYISHGIGEGAYIYFDHDLAKSYAFSVAQYFKNVGSCGNGFYHGISIGLSRNAKSDDELYSTLKDFCKTRDKQAGLGEDNCNHGLGHAVTIYYEHDKDKSIAMCERIYAGGVGENSSFGCLTGVMMELGMYLDYLGISTKGIDGLEDLCKGYKEGTDEREACILEGSGVVRYGEDYIGAVNACQTLSNATERKACTKLNVIHAIRLSRNVDVTKLCKIPASRSERIECTAFFAKYLAIAVDISRGPEFIKVLDGVCHTLPLLDYIKCQSIQNQHVSTFRSNVDYGSYITFSDIKYYIFGFPIKKNVKEADLFGEMFK